MLRIANLSLPLDYSDESLRLLAARKLKIAPARVKDITLVKKSVDARDKGDVHFVLTVDVRAEGARQGRGQRSGHSCPTTRRNITAPLRGGVRPGISAS